MRPVALLVPGAIDQLTGGSLYARGLVDGLRGHGIDVTVSELAGRFPVADAAALAACEAALGERANGTIAVIDGLALAGCADCLERAAGRLRVVALVHHSLAEETGIAPDATRSFAALEALLLPLAAAVVCPSEATARDLRRRGVASARIAVIPPGTDKPARVASRIAHGGPCRLLSVGTVTPRKGHDLAIAALARIGDRAWNLRIIGSLTRDPAAGSRLRAAIASAGLGGRVTLEGEFAHEFLAAAYASADVFLSASHHEGYGMALAEALAHGLPVVATRAGAIPETVPESAGILVPPGDGRALAAALARIIDDGRLRARLAAGAAAAGAALPRWDDVVRAWMRRLERVGA